VLKTFDFESLIPEDHPARAIWQVVGGLDLSAFYVKVAAREGKAGRAATDPKLLLALWLYATSEGVGSARELERLTMAHDAYKWLCGGVRVNHHTLSDFRVGHEKALDALMTQLLGVLLQQKLVKLKRVANDGMRVRASAGAGSFRRERALRECLDEATAHLAAVKREAERSDPTRSEREKTARHRAAQERQRRIEKALSELPKAQAAKKKDEKGEE
jgi:transposase